MADRPIIFSAPMVRALIEGRKTQTRRVMKPPYGTLQWLGNGQWRPICTKFFPGDRLWVREAFVTGFDIDDEFGHPVGDRKVWSRATDSGLSWYDPDTETTLDNPPWKPSIHMPRWASRLTLTVTEVRVQRLQDISEADAVAEGMPGRPKEFMDTTLATSRLWFRDLWNSLHGPEAWDANPWVAAASFTVAMRNIDAREAASPSRPSPAARPAAASR